MQQQEQQQQSTFSKSSLFRDAVTLKDANNTQNGRARCLLLLLLSQLMVPLTAADTAKHSTSCSCNEQMSKPCL
jgi:hypothetical protein